MTLVLPGRVAQIAAATQEKNRERHPTPLLLATHHHGFAFTSSHALSSVRGARGERHPLTFHEITYDMRRLALQSAAFQRSTNCASPMAAVLGTRDGLIGLVDIETSINSLRDIINPISQTVRHVKQCEPSAAAVQSVDWLGNLISLSAAGCVCGIDTRCRASSSSAAFTFSFPDVTSTIFDDDHTVIAGSDGGMVAVFDLRLIPAASRTVTSCTVSPHCVGAINVISPVVTIVKAPGATDRIAAIAADRVVFFRSRDSSSARDEALCPDPLASSSATPLSAFTCGCAAGEDGVVVGAANGGAWFVPTDTRYDIVRWPHPHHCSSQITTAPTNPVSSGGGACCCTSVAAIPSNQQDGSGWRALLCVHSASSNNTIVAQRYPRALARAS